MPNIIETAGEVGPFRTLTGAIDAAGMKDRLSRRGPWTLFAPTDEAFENLSRQSRDLLFRNPSLLGKVISRHVVPGDLRAADLTKHRYLRNILGEQARLRHKGRIFFCGAQILHMDLIADNGVVHAIDNIVFDHAQCEDGNTRRKRTPRQTA